MYNTFFRYTFYTKMCNCNKNVQRLPSPRPYTDRQTDTQTYRHTHTHTSEKRLKSMEVAQVPETFQLNQYVCLRDTGPQGRLWGLDDGS